MWPPEIDLDHPRHKHDLLEDDTGKWIFEMVEYKELQESSVLQAVQGRRRRNGRGERKGQELTHGNDRKTQVREIFPFPPQHYL